MKRLARLVAAASIFGAVAAGPLLLPAPAFANSTATDGSGVQLAVPASNGNFAHCDAAYSTLTVSAGANVVFSMACQYWAGTNGYTGTVQGLSIWTTFQRANDGAIAGNWVGCSPTSATWTITDGVGKVSCVDISHQLTDASGWVNQALTILPDYAYPSSAYSCNIAVSGFSAISGTQCGITSRHGGSGDGSAVMPHDYWPGGSAGAPAITARDGAFPKYDCVRSLEEVDGKWYVEAAVARTADDVGLTRAQGGTVDFTDDYWWRLYWLADPSSGGSWATGSVDNKTLARTLLPTAPASGGTWALQVNVRRTLEPGHGFPLTGIPTPSTSGLVGNSITFTQQCLLLADPTQPGTGASASLGNLPPYLGDFNLFPRCSGTLMQTDPTCDPGAAARLKACIPNGWAILNPAAYVKSTSCVFTWAFIPKRAGSGWTDLQAAVKPTVVGQVVTITGQVFDAPATFVSQAGGTSDCHGPAVDLTVLTPAAGTIYPMSSCAGASVTAASLTKTILSLSLVLGAMVTCINYVMRLWGGPTIQTDGIES